MSKKNTNQAQIIGLKTQKTKTPTITQKHFANESLEDRLDHLDERVEILAERHELPEAASIERLGLNDIADAFVPLEKANGLIEGLGKVEKESVLDELTGSVSFGPAFGVTDGDLKAAAFAGKGMAGSNGGGMSDSKHPMSVPAPSNSDQENASTSAHSSTSSGDSSSTQPNNAGTNSTDQLWEVQPNGENGKCLNIPPSGPGVRLPWMAELVLEAACGVTRALQNDMDRQERGGGTENIVRDAIKNLGWPNSQSDPDDRPGLEDRGGNYSPSAVEVAKAWKELRNWSDPSSTPGVNDEDDTLISNPQAIDQSKIRDKFGKWFSDDYYNDEGSASADKNAAISSKDISVNWGDDGAPVVLGSNPVGTGTTEPSNPLVGDPEPVIAAPEEFF